MISIFLQAFIKPYETILYDFYAFSSHVFILLSFSIVLVIFPSYYSYFRVFFTTKENEEN